jgi:hypothetical protein
MLTAGPTVHTYTASSNLSSGRESLCKNQSNGGVLPSYSSDGWGSRPHSLITRYAVPLRHRADTGATSRGESRCRTAAVLQTLATQRASPAPTRGDLSLRGSLVSAVQQLNPWLIRPVNCGSIFLGGSHSCWCSVMQASLQARATPP